MIKENNSKKTLIQSAPDPKTISLLNSSSLSSNSSPNLISEISISENTLNSNLNNNINLESGSGDQININNDKILLAKLFADLDDLKCLFFCFYFYFYFYLL